MDDIFIYKTTETLASDNLLLASCFSECIMVFSGASQRDPALQLASLMCESCGVTWAFGPQGDNRKFLLLLVHLTCIEVRMTLEDKQLIEVGEQSSGNLNDIHFDELNHELNTTIKASACYT